MTAIGLLLVCWSTGWNPYLIGASVALLAVVGGIHLYLHWLLRQSRQRLTEAVQRREEAEQYLAEAEQEYEEASQQYENAVQRALLQMGVEQSRQDKEVH